MRAWCFCSPTRWATPRCCWPASRRRASKGVGTREDAGRGAGVTALSILVVGLLLGTKHATEADHLAAVATLATRQGSLAQTLRQGVAWGVGHNLTLMLFGGAVLWLGQVVSPRLEQGLETAVGMMLVLLGADVLRRLVRDRIHFHVHRHRPGTVHVHARRHRDVGRDGHPAHRHAHPKR